MVKALIHFYLQEAGVHGSLTHIEEFSLTLMPFDSDLLSMEMENSFRVSYSRETLSAWFAKHLLFFFLYYFSKKIAKKGQEIHR